MKNKNLISTKKICRMQFLAFENCLRLHKDSIVLFRVQSYPSAYYLSVISLEEFGKVLWIDDCLFHTRLNEMDRYGQEMWLNATLNHSAKQSIFGHSFEMSLPKLILKLIKNKQIEVEKQNSIYVGLPRDGGKVKWEGRINNPINISRNKAHRQISVMNDCLLETVIGNIKGVYNFDSYDMELLLDRKMFIDLSDNWDYVSEKTRKFICKVEKLYGDFED